MYFPRLVSLVIATYKISNAYAELNHLNMFNDDDGVDLKTSSFFAGNGNDDASYTAEDAINQQMTTNCVSTTSQEDLLLSTGSPSSNTNLFVRDHEQCLPPVNIGANVLNLWQDPLFELERQITTPTSGDKTPGATGPLEGLGPGLGPGPGPGSGPEGPKIPSLLAPFDHPDESNDLGSDQPDWKDYEGSEYDKQGTRIDSYGSERLDDDDIDGEYGIDEEEYNPCKAPWRPDGYVYDLCCTGPAFMSRQVTEWKYDAVMSCDRSEFSFSPL